MSFKAVLGVLVALAAVGFVIPTVAAGPIDTGDHQVTVDERVRVQQNLGAASLDAEVATGRHDVYARGPSCYLESEDVADTPERCTTPEVSASTSDPAVDVDVDLTVLGARPTGSGDEDAPHTMMGFIAPASQDVPLALATAVAGASALTLYGAWRFLRFLAFAGFIPLYSYIPDEKLLDDPNRRRIFELIREQPGTSTKDIAERLDLAWGTATHHLNKLEKRRMIVSKKFGKYRRYFANGAVPNSDRKEAVAVLRVPQTADVAAYIRAHPGLSQKEVSQRLDVSASTILWHVKRLARVGLVEKVRDGKRVKYFPTAALEAAAEVAPAHAAPAATAGGEERSFFVA